MQRAIRALGLADGVLREDDGHTENTKESGDQSGVIMIGIIVMIVVVMVVVVLVVGMIIISSSNTEEEEQAQDRPGSLV